jgi:DNA-binding transcriptional LysR family regulator
MSNNGEANCKMAANGLGITQMPTFLCADALRSGAVVEVLRDFRPSPTGLHAVFPHGRNLSMKTRVLIDYVAEVFTPTPYWDEGIV